MKHPHEKFIIAEMATILLSIILGLVALLNGFVLLIFVSFYCIAIGFICEGIIEWSTRQTMPAVKQFSRAMVIFVLASYLIFKF